MGGEFSIIVMGFTIACVVLGFLLGMLRGRNRSILRFVIVLGCAVGAFFLKDVLIETAMSLEIEGQTLKDTLVATMSETAELPEYLSQLIVSLVEVIVGLVCFLVLFFALQFFSWIILFPILKIFVRREGKKKILFGGIVGVLQGVIVAFVICSPLTGAIVQVEHRNEVIKRSRNVDTSEKSHAANRDESTHRGDGRLKVKILLAPPKTSTANVKIQVKPPIASSNLVMTAINGHVVKRLTQRSELNGV